MIQTQKHKPRSVRPLSSERTPRGSHRTQGPQENSRGFSAPWPPLHGRNWRGTALPKAPQIPGHGRDPLPFREGRAEGPPPARRDRPPRALQGAGPGRGQKAWAGAVPALRARRGALPARGSAVRGGPFVRGRPGLPAPAPGRGYGGSRPPEAPRAGRGRSTTVPSPVRPLSVPSVSPRPPHSPSAPPPPPPLPRLPGRGVETPRTTCPRSVRHASPTAARSSPRMRSARG